MFRATQAHASTAQQRMTFSIIVMSCETEILWGFVGHFHRRLALARES